MIIGLMYVDESARVSTLKYTAVADGATSLGLKLKEEGFRFDESEGLWYWGGGGMPCEGMPCRLETHTVGWVTE